MTTIRQDIRYAFRTFARNPGFTLLAVATLALGIGANTTMFSVVSAVLLRPLGYPEPDRLVGFSTNQSGPDLEDLSQSLRRAGSVAGAQTWPLDYVGGAEPERVRAGVVTGAAFATLGAKARMGRVILPRDDRPGAEPVVVVGDAFWRTRLGADRGVLGRSLNLGGRLYTIVGVAAEGFEIPRVRADLFVPFRVAAAEAAPARGAHLLRAFGRLAPKATIREAQAELDAAAARLREVHPEEDKEQTFSLVPLHEQLVARSRPTLLVLLGAVAVVLLVACANFANLLLSRSSRRRRELSVRAALGAGRYRLIRQLVTESFLLALAGGAAGVLLAAWGQEVVSKLPILGSASAPAVRLDARVLLFALAVSAATGLLFGLLPALTMVRPAGSAEGLSGRGSDGPGASRVSRWLVVGEIAVALALLNGAALLFRGLARLQSEEPGFRTDHVLTFHLDLPETRYREIAPRTLFFDRLRERIGAVPGVRGVALVSEVPLVGPPLDHNLVVEGGPAYAPGEEPSAYSRTVSPGYFRTIEIALTRGRDFTDADRADAPLVGVVNESFVRKFLAGRDPLGARVRWARSAHIEWMAVVGVARDVKHLGLAEGDGPAVYAPYAQNKQVWKRWSSVVVRTDGDPRRSIGAVKDAVHSLDPELPVEDVATMEEVVQSASASPSHRNLVIALFASLALGLALIGVYGVMSQWVARRTQEIGIRMALGAGSADVFRLVVGQALLLAATGVLLGVAGGAVLARAFLSKLLFGFAATDPATHAAMAAALLAAVVLASCLPARRAIRVNPVEALQS